MIDPQKVYLVSGDKLAELQKSSDEWNNLIVQMTDATVAKLTRGEAQSILEIPKLPSATSGFKSLDSFQVSVDSGNIKMEAGFVRATTNFTATSIESSVAEWTVAIPGDGSYRLAVTVDYSFTFTAPDGDGKMNIDAVSVMPAVIWGSPSDFGFDNSSTGIVWDMPRVKAGEIAPCCDVTTIYDPSGDPAKFWALGDIDPYYNHQIFVIADVSISSGVVTVRQRKRGDIEITAVPIIIYAKLAS